MTPDELARLRGPIGLDLGGRAPAETALAIMAEIVADRHGGSGRPMLDLVAASRLTAVVRGGTRVDRTVPASDDVPARDRGRARPTCSATPPTSRSTTGPRSPSATSGPSRASRPSGLRAALGGPLPEHGEDPRAVVDALVGRGRARARGDGLAALLRLRHRRSVPAALAADWLTATWDQNVVLYLATPAASVVEEVAAGWLVELLGLPAGHLGRVHDGRDDGQLHGARRRPPRRPPRAPAGTSRRTA